MNTKINILFYATLVATQLDASLTESVNNTQISFARPTQAPTAMQTLSTSANRELNSYAPNLRGTKLNIQKNNSNTLTGSIDYILLAGQNLTNTTNPTEYPTAMPIKVHDSNTTLADKLSPLAIMFPILLICCTKSKDCCKRRRPAQPLIQEPEFTDEQLDAGLK